MALTDKEEQLIKNKLPRCSTLLTSIIGKLYIADPSDEYEWMDTDCVGAISLIVNRRLDSVILRVYVESFHIESTRINNQRSRTTIGTM